MDTLITIVFAIVGWVAVHFLSERRDIKKEWRDFARATVKFVNSIEKASHKYHTSTSRDKDLEQKIKSDLNFLEVRLILITEHLSFKHDISFLRASITLDNFESAHYQQQAKHSPLMQNITWHANHLKEQLYRAK